MNYPIPTLDRLIVVIGPPQSGKTLNATAISRHFDCLVYEDLDTLARDFQFDDFVSAALLCAESPSVQISGSTEETGPRFVVKHQRRYVYAREIRMESPERLSNVVVGWKDPKPMEKL